MKYKRWLSLILALLLTLSLCSAGAWAAETEAEPEWKASEGAEAEEAVESAVQTPEQEPTQVQQSQEKQLPRQDGEGTLFWVNPGYECSREDLASELEELERPELETQSSTKTVASIKDAGKYFREQLKKRKKSVTLTLKTKNSSGYNLWNDVFEEAVKITGVPNEGDYLYGNILTVAGKYKTKYAKKKYTHTFVYNMRYTATADQEKKVDAAVTKLLKQLDLKKDSKFVRVHKIYNWMCDNITYDDAGANSNAALCHSAYAALVKKKAVCQGYATLLYRLLTECDVPCRFIGGTGYDSAGSGPHAWNIVKLGSKYYNVDVTWDASRRQKGGYFNYFLRNDANFGGHVRDSRCSTSAFQKACPMSSKDGDFHYWETDVIQEASCTLDGLRQPYCSDCGQTKAVEVVPALGHDWEPDWDNVVTYSDCFAVQAYCSRCGLRDSQWYYYDYEGNPIGNQSGGMEAEVAGDVSTQAIAAALEATKAG